MLSKPGYKRWGAIASVAGILAGVGVIALASTGVRDPQGNSAPAIGTDFHGVLSGKVAPFPGAVTVSLQQIQALIEGPLLVPDSTLASTACLDKLWVASSSTRDPQEVVLVFSTQIAVYLTRQEVGPSADELKNDAKKFGPALAWEATIRGRPALVIKANGVGQGNVGSVDLTIPPNRAVILGYQSPDDLIAVAQSLQAYDSSTKATACG